MVGKAIQFHGSATGGKSPYQWQWNFGDGETSNLQNPVHSYNNEGVYVATLTVIDSIGNIASDSAYVYIFKEDNQAPHVQIVKPRNALYMNDRKIVSMPFTIVIGNVTVEANASDDIGISKLEFYIDNELKHTNYSYPYYWLWNQTAIGKHGIKVIAYDFAGYTAMDEQKVWIFNI